MKTRRLVNNDYSFGNSRADIISGKEAILQTCKTRIMQLKGEWFLDARDGVRWGDVLGHKQDTGSLNSLIKRTLLSVEGVTEVIDVDAYVLGRSVSVIAKLRTKEGELPFSQSFNALEMLYDKTN